MIIQMFNDKRLVQNATLEVHRFQNGDIHYSLRRCGNTYDIDGEEKAREVIRNYGMIDVSEQAHKIGFIK